MKTKTSKSEESESKVPTDLRGALAANQKAMIQWKDLTPIARRDFISWIDSAKQSETRSRRINVACSKLVAGKRRPCCYALVPMNLYKALGANKAAKREWSGLTPDARRNFIDWIDSTKESETRTNRIDKVCSMLAAGKRRP